MPRLKSPWSPVWLLGPVTALGCLSACPAVTLAPISAPSAAGSASPAPTTNATATPGSAVSPAPGSSPTATPGAPSTAPGSSSSTAAPQSTSAPQATATPLATPTPAAGATATPTPTPTATATATPTPAASSGQAPVTLSSALNKFLVLGGQGVTNTGPTSIAGEVGVSPAALTAITGFGTVTFSNGGSIRPTTESATAQQGLTAAYNDAAGRATAPNILGSTINGKTLAPGLYRTSAATVVGPQDLVLDASSAANPASAVFIFQIHDALTTAATSHVVLTGGAQARNVFWQVGSSATLGANSVMKGSILALTSITVGQNTALQGQAFARNGAVTLDTDTLTSP